MRLAHFQSMTHRQRRLREGAVLFLNLALLAAAAAIALWKASHD